MNKPLKTVLILITVYLFIAESTQIYAQVNWVVGGRLGLSIYSGGGGSSAGLQFGPMAEVLFNRNMAVGTEFNINTQGGTPIEWANQFKYYFDVPQSDINRNIVTKNKKVPKDFFIIAPGFKKFFL